MPSANRVRDSDDPTITQCLMKLSVAGRSKSVVNLDVLNPEELRGVASAIRFDSILASKPE